MACHCVYRCVIVDVFATRVVVMMELFVCIGGSSCLDLGISHLLGVIGGSGIHKFVSGPSVGNLVPICLLHVVFRVVLSTSPTNNFADVHTFFRLEMSFRSIWLSGVIAKRTAMAITKPLSSGPNRFCAMVQLYGGSMIALSVRWMVTADR